MTVKGFLIQETKIILILLASFYFEDCSLSFFYPRSSCYCFQLHSRLITTKYFPILVFHIWENLFIHLFHSYRYLLFIPTHIELVWNFKTQIPKLQQKMIGSLCFIYLSKSGIHIFLQLRYIPKFF